MDAVETLQSRATDLQSRIVDAEQAAATAVFQQLGAGPKAKALDLSAAAASVVALKTELAATLQAIPLAREAIEQQKEAERQAVQALVLGEASKKAAVAVTASRKVDEHLAAIAALVPVILAGRDAIGGAYARCGIHPAMRIADVITPKSVVKTLMASGLWQILKESDRNELFRWRIGETHDRSFVPMTDLIEDMYDELQTRRGVAE